MRRLEFDEPAAADLLEARDYYRRHSSETAARFVEEVGRALEVIVEAPERWPRRRGARQYALRGFPYSLVYKLVAKADLVVVLAVAHQRRRPGYWRGR